MDINPKNIGLFLLDNGEVIRQSFDEYPERTLTYGKRTFLATHTWCNASKHIRWITYEEQKDNT